MGLLLGLTDAAPGAVPGLLLLLAGLVVVALRLRFFSLSEGARVPLTPPRRLKSIKSYPLLIFVSSLLRIFVHQFLSVSRVFTYAGGRGDGGAGSRLPRPHTPLLSPLPPLARQYKAKIVV